MADDNPFLLLQELGDRLSDRKRLLFVVACWRDAWDLIPEQDQREAVRVLETFAETNSCQIGSRPQPDCRSRTSFGTGSGVSREAFSHSHPGTKLPQPPRPPFS